MLMSVSEAVWLCRACLAVQGQPGFSAWSSFTKACLFNLVSIPETQHTSMVVMNLYPPAPPLSPSVNFPVWDD